jgi:acetylcholinesterase
MSHLIHFVNNLDPNGPSGLVWPRYTNASPQLMVYQNSKLRPMVIKNDTERVEAMAYLTEVTLENPI